MNCVRKQLNKPNINLIFHNAAILCHVRGSQLCLRPQFVPDGKQNLYTHMFYDQMLHRPQRFLGKQHVTPCAYLQNYGDRHQRNHQHVVRIVRSRLQKLLHLGSVGRQQREVKQTLCYRLLGRVVVVRKVLAIQIQEASVQIVHLWTGNWKLAGQREGGGVNNPVNILL